jgi:type VI secretion system protein ImpJ
LPEYEQAQVAVRQAPHANDPNAFFRESIVAGSKVLWGEGLLLLPQHLQQQDRYHERRLHRLANALQPHLWGVQALRWNADALANNMLRADVMQLIFQDGVLFDAPGADTLPLAVDLALLPATSASVLIYAALPALKEHGGNVVDPDDAQDDRRYVLDDVATPDLYSSAGSADLRLLGTAVHLVSHFDTRNSYLNFPVVRLLRKESGGFEIDPTFVPPSVTLIGAGGLHKQLLNLMERLHAKSDALYRALREPRVGQVEVGSADTAIFALLHTVNAGYAALRRYAHFSDLHPEKLFAELTRLAGGLTCFSRLHRMTELPDYEHAGPGPVFARLYGIIGELIETMVSSKLVSIPLLKNGDDTMWHRATLDPAVIVDGVGLYLALQADMPGMELVASALVRFKVGGPAEVDMAVRAAISGIKLMHLTMVPPAIPVKPDTYYFALESKSELFKKMLKAQAIAIFAADGIPNMKLELFAVMP